MNVSPFDPKVTAPGADGPDGPGDGEASAEACALPDGDDDPRREEPTDEPGYGHGV